jgi:hypothetical protein
MRKNLTSYHDARSSLSRSADHFKALKGVSDDLQDGCGLDMLSYVPNWSDVEL